jgi:peroxiredoxin
MTGLTDELNAFMTGLLERVDPHTAEIITRNKLRLDQSGIVAQAIGVGDQAPDFTLFDQDEVPFSLRDALRRGPAVVLFVRGGWCPFCAITLRAFDAARHALEREGATLVAGSPATQAHSKATTERELLRYSLLSDCSMKVAESYGLLWEPDAELQAIYTRLGHDVPRINGTGGWRMPIPASYVIGQDGIVHAARVDTSLVDRLGPNAALAHVKALAQA